MNQNRRNFLSKIGMAALAVPFLSSFKNKNNNTEMKNVFLHHVFFWLNDPSSVEDRSKLVEGLTKLSAVKAIKNFHIGKPADTNRDVIERGYSISWFVQFDNAADQASYQTDPIHLQFIEECKHLWSKVTVYDSVDVK
ncbi:MAG: Dabb family protein [Bacteroidota bacterium]